MKRVIFFVFIITIIPLYSQQSKIDSLKIILKETSSIEKRVLILESLNSLLISKSNLKESIIYFSEMISISKKLSNKELEARGYKYLSEAYLKDMDSIKSISFAKKAIETDNSLKGFLLGVNQLGRVYHQFQLYNLAIRTYQRGLNKHTDNLKNNLLVLISKIYKNQSIAYDKIGDKNKSVDLVLKSIKISEKLGDFNEMSYDLYLLGYTYMELGNLEKAEEYFLKSLSYSKKVTSDVYIYFNHHSLGINYSRWGKYKKALHHNKIALDYFRKKGDKLYEFDVLNNTAVVYKRLKKYKETLNYAQKALFVAEKINHKLAINGAKMTLLNAFINLSNYDKAEKILLDLAKDTINVKYISRDSRATIYSYFAELYEGKKNFKKSIKYLKKFNTLNDSIQKENLESKFSDLEVKYQTEQKEKENLQLKADNAEQELLTQKANTRNWLLAIGLLAISISAFFIWKRYKSEEKAKQLIGQQKTQIEKLQKEFHHRIKNDFRSINSFIRLTQKKFPETEFQERLNELKNRVTSMFKVHELLLQQEDITHVKAKPYLKELSDNVKQKYDSKNVTLKCDVDDAEIIVADKSVPFGVILNEFVTNSYKHAFDKNGGDISINFHSDSYNHYLTLKDNGKGLPSNFNKNNLRSFGLEIMPLLAEQYDGEFKLESDNGVSVIVTLPKQIA